MFTPAEAAEFLDVYGLKVLPIPTALPVARRDNEDAVFKVVGPLCHPLPISPLSDQLYEVVGLLCNPHPVLI